MASPPIQRPSWAVVPPQTPAVTPARPDPRAAAQRAFFEAALAGRTATAANETTAAEAAAPRASAAQATRAVAATEARADDKLPRPGSIIDIYV
ncbi:MAG TPA: hypothetical protein VGL58_13290 [Caulobacteraceae bacterium]|jgi:hypothetical protein